MQMMDFECQTCGEQRLDRLMREGSPWPECCGVPCVKIRLGKPSSVVSDECDVWVKNGLCNEDGSPRHYRFKSEMRAEARRRGLVNVVEHLGSQGSDKNPHTQRWI